MLAQLENPPPLITLETQVPKGIPEVMTRHDTLSIGLEHYLIVSALLFSLGLLGVITRRNILVIYMSLELMLNAANLALVAFSRFNNNLDGQVMVFFIITVAAAEVAVGLALIVALFRRRQATHVEDLTFLKL
jgi:NADH-quinone oxidoreductase subunit K